MQQNQAQSECFSPVDWDRYAKCYDALTKLLPYQELSTSVYDALSPTPDDYILDAGCGTGNIITQVCQKGAGAKLVGVDRSSNMLARAARKHPKGVSLLRADLNRPLPFKDDLFTKVVSSNVLYAMRNPEQTLREIARVLKAHGMLVLVTPKYGYENGLILKAHCGSNKSDVYWSNAHASEAREEKLITEALTDTTLAQMMLFVARCNRAIARNVRFHFFEQDTLVRLVNACGLTLVKVKLTYAGQGILIVARKEASDA